MTMPNLQGNKKMSMPNEQKIEAARELVLNRFLKTEEAVVFIEKEIENATEEDREYLELLLAQTKLILSNGNRKSFLTRIYSSVLQFLKEKSANEIIAMILRIILSSFFIILMCYGVFVKNL